MSPIVLENISIKNLKFCKECMSINDLSLYQPVFRSGCNVCRLLSLPFFLWSQSKMATAENTERPFPRSTEKSAHYRLKASLTPRVILHYRGAKGGGQWRVARGWRKMSRGLSFSPHFRLRRARSQALLYTYLFNCGYWSESMTFTAVWW